MVGRSERGGAAAGAVGALVGAAVLPLLGAPGAVDLLVAIGVVVCGASAAILVVGAVTSRRAQGRAAERNDPPAPPRTAEAR